MGPNIAPSRPAKYTPPAIASPVKKGWLLSIKDIKGDNDNGHKHTLVPVCASNYPSI